MVVTFCESKLPPLVAVPETEELVIEWRTNAPPNTRDGGVSLFKCLYEEDIVQEKMNSEGSVDSWLPGGAEEVCCWI